MTKSIRPTLKSNSPAGFTAINYGSSCSFEHGGAVLKVSVVTFYGHSAVIILNQATRYKIANLPPLPVSPENQVRFAKALVSLEVSEGAHRTTFTELLLWAMDDSYEEIYDGIAPFDGYSCVHGHMEVSEDEPVQMFEILIDRGLVRKTLVNMLTYINPLIKDLVVWTVDKSVRINAYGVEDNLLAWVKIMGLQNIDEESIKDHPYPSERKYEV